jgi:hypothetical protein
VVKRHKGRRTITRKQTLILGKGSFSVAAGKDTTVTLRLTPIGRQRLKHVKRHPLRAKLVLSVAGARSFTEQAVVS